MSLLITVSARLRPGVRRLGQPYPGSSRSVVSIRVSKIRYDRAARLRSFLIILLTPEVGCDHLFAMSAQVAAYYR